LRIYNNQNPFYFPKAEDENTEYKVVIHKIVVPSLDIKTVWLQEPDTDVEVSKGFIVTKNYETVYPQAQDVLEGENEIGEIPPGKYVITKTEEKKTTVRAGYGNAVFMLTPSQDTTLKTLQNPWFNRRSSIYKLYYIDGMFREKIGRKFVSRNLVGVTKSTFSGYSYNPTLRIIPYQSRLNYLKRKQNVIVDLGMWMSFYFQYSYTLSRKSICTNFINFLAGKMGNELFKEYQKTLIIDITHWFESKKLNIASSKGMTDPLTILYYTLYKFPDLIDNLPKVNFIILDSNSKQVLKIAPQDFDHTKFSTIKNRLMMFPTLKTLAEVESLQEEENLENRNEIVKDVQANIVKSVRYNLVGDKAVDIANQVIATDPDYDKEDIKIHNEDTSIEVEAATNKALRKKPALIVAADKQQVIDEIVDDVKREVFVNSYMPTKTDKEMRKDDELRQQQSALLKLPSTSEMTTKVIEEEDLSKFVRTKNPALQKSKYINFNKAYNTKKLESDIDACVAKLSEAEYPLYVIEKEVEDTSDSMNLKKTYHWKLKDFRGEIHNISLDIPILIDDTYMYIRGSKKLIQHQRLFLPIVHVSPDMVQFVAFYNKLILTRGGIGDAVAIAIKKYISLNRDKFKVKAGSSIAINRLEYRTGIVYDFFSRDIYSFEVGDNVFILDINALLKTLEEQGIPYKKPKEFTRYPVGYNKKTKEVYTQSDKDDFAKLIYEKFDNVSVNDVSKLKYGRSKFYTKCKIAGENIPISLFLIFCVGFSKFMEYAGIEYKIVSKSERKQYDGLNWGIIDLLDGYIVWKRDSLATSLLMNCFYVRPLSNISDVAMRDLDNKGVWVAMLRQVKGYKSKNNIENILSRFRDFMIDPVTREILEDHKVYDFPLDTVHCLIYASSLLANNSYIRKGDMNAMRIRSNEMIPYFVYKTITRGYEDFHNSLSTHRRAKKVRVGREDVLNALQMSKLTEENSVLNPTLELEKNRSITFKGEGGIQKDHSFKEGIRSFDDSMVGTIAISTSPDAQAGIVRQLTLEPGITSTRGYVNVTAKEKVNTLNNTQLLSPAELLTPFAAVHDDPQRTAMMYKQSKYTIPVEDPSPVIVGNKTEAVIPYHTSKEFSIVAEQDGKVVDVKNDQVVIHYKDGTYLTINTSPEVKRNTASSFYIESKLKCDLKLDEKVKRGQVVAYNPSFFTKNEDDLSASMNLGVLTKVAVLPNWDLYEDSAPVTRKLSYRMRSVMLDDVKVILDKNAAIRKMVSVGDTVKVGDELIIFEQAASEEETNDFMDAIRRNYGDKIPPETHSSKKAKHAGVISDIKIYSTVDLEMLNSSIQPYVKAYWEKVKKRQKLYDVYKNKNDSKFYKSGNLITELPGPIKTDSFGRLFGQDRVGEGVLIQIFIRYEVAMGKGDKITQQNALKSIISNVIPQGLEPYAESRPDEEISTLIPQLSVFARKTSSIFISMMANKLVIELKRKLKEDYMK
jgi:hypothetical protein